MADIKFQPVLDGFQNTEVGIIPSIWEVQPLSKLTSMMTNGFVGTAKTHYTDKSNGVLYIQGYNVKENGFNFRGIKKVTQEFHKRQSKSCLRNGDVLMVQTGDVGLTTIVPEALVGSNCHALIISRFKLAKLNPLFFCYYLNSSQGRSRLKELEVGTTMKHINVGDLLHFVVPVPSSKKEQTAISNALSDVDNLINSLEKLIVKKQAIKIGAMQQLLTGKKRLTPFNQKHTGYKQTELGQIPEDWEIVELGNIGQNLIGLTYSPNDVVNQGTLVLRSSNVQKNKLAFENNVFVDMVLPRRVIVEKGDILICVRNGSKQLIGKCALIDKKTEGVAFGAFMSIYRTEYSSFIFYQFQSNIIQRQIDEIMGATINQITNKDMAVFKVPMPSDSNEQTAIANILIDIDSEIDILEERLNKTKQLKQGMMQELLTGRTRLI